MSRVNWPIALLGVMFWYLETKFFGWNVHPSSVSELFADGLSLAFYAAALAFPRKLTAKPGAEGEK